MGLLNGLSSIGNWLSARRAKDLIS